MESMFRDHPLFTLENLYRAYLACRRGKRNTQNGLRFEQNLEENLIDLQEELISGGYQPGQSVAFLVEKPKRREIFAADFRDRVVHHLLVRHLELRWERRIIRASLCLPEGQRNPQGRGATEILHPPSDGEREETRLVLTIRHSRLFHLGHQPPPSPPQY